MQYSKRLIKLKITILSRLIRFKMKLLSLVAGWYMANQMVALIAMAFFSFATYYIHNLRTRGE